LKLKNYNPKETVSEIFTNCRKFANKLSINFRDPSVFKKYNTKFNKNLIVGDPYKKTAEILIEELSATTLCYTGVLLLEEKINRTIK